jgi:hypothetical protein
LSAAFEQRSLATFDLLTRFHHKIGVMAVDHVVQRDDRGT